MKQRPVRDRECRYCRNSCEERFRTLPGGSLTKPKSERGWRSCCGTYPLVPKILSPRRCQRPRQRSPPYLDENVQFTVYRPQTVQPWEWHTLLVFAHLSERPPDAKENEPDPLEEVERQARQVLGEQFPAYHDVTQDSAQPVPREGELTFVPEVAGIEFNPPHRSFLWEEAVHREEFRLRAVAGMNGRTARGQLTVYLGSILLAEIALTIRVDSSQQQSRPAFESAHATPYRKIFPSYSHKDEAIVAQFEGYAAALGDEYLRDVTHLRAGEVWSARLEDMIRDAHVFQLFWSSNSMRSRFVQQEWQHALSLARPNFIRPTYWEEPLPGSPAEDLPPRALLRLHFHRLVTSAPHPRATSDAPQLARGTPPTPSSSPEPGDGQPGRENAETEPPRMPRDSRTRESTQHKLDRVRQPRVQITYDVEQGAALEKRELPFVVGVLAETVPGNPTARCPALRSVGLSRSTGTTSTR